MTGTIEAFLSSMGSSGGAESRRGEEHTSLPLEQCLAALRDQAARMQLPCPYKAGDLITVRAGTDVKGAGKPHIVVEVLAEPVTDTKAEAGSNQFLRTYSMRVCHFHGDSLTVHAVDHSCFETWTEAHAVVWRQLQTAQTHKSPRKVASDTPLTEVVRMLRSEGKKLSDAKITWKKGDLVELVGFESSHAAKPMAFEGRAVGFVVTVDHSDDTTRVVYYDEDGDRRSQWFKATDLKNYNAVEPV